MLLKLVSIVCVFLVAALLISASPAIAGDAASGAKVFSANCAACHTGGKNVIQANKTLNKDALEKYGMNSLEAITNQIYNGKNAMPAFRGRLKDEQIEDVATYVLSQAEQGW